MALSSIDAAHLYIGHSPSGGIVKTPEQMQRNKEILCRYLGG